MHLFGPSQYAILPDEIVDRDDLPELVDRAERAVLDRYTVVQGDGPVVKLNGYDSDPALIESELLTRLRYTIADVIEHWVNLPDLHVASEARGARSVSFRAVIETMPRQAFALLADYDLREPLWRV